MKLEVKQWDAIFDTNEVKRSSGFSRKKFRVKKIEAGIIWPGKTNFEVKHRSEPSKIPRELRSLQAHH